MADPIIRASSPALVEDYLRFFDHDAFADNPKWASCYCYFYHAPHEQTDWGTRAGAENRAAVRELCCDGRMHGYLAYVAGKPVGWCHAAPRCDIPNLQASEALRVDDVNQVGAIVCFVVAKPYRGQGIARQLLDAACDGFMRQGLVIAEAYPRKGTNADAANYHGPLQMYLAAGFQPFREFEDFLIVRKPLG
jgi:GNAT superfamily N-acetyltransferase